ncbi:MAG TPA: YceI family protein [Polyangia bacterium]|jgi:polyisoprenoid-binding protein YceI
MRRARPGLVLALVAGAWLGLADRAGYAEPSRFEVDAQASRVVIHVGKSGVFGFAGHEHEVVAPAVRGSVTADAAQLARSSVEVTFDAAALRVTGAGEPAKDVPDVQKTMLGPECLDAASFPTIRFESRAVTDAGAEPGGRRVAIHGALTLHGVTRAITLPARVALDRDTVEATGTFVVRQTDFGIKPISKAGVVNVKDELDVRWRLVARRSHRG